MNLRLVGKIAMVTGTGSQIGFGRGVAVFLAQEGCDIVSVDLDLEGAQKTADEAKALGRRASAYKLDITKKADVDQVLERILADFGRIDILVNCAGRASGLRPFQHTTEEQWNLDIDINLKGTLHVTHAVLPHMLERKYGKIVNFSTHAANQPTGLAGTAPYVAAKAGVVMLSKTIAGEVGPEGINVNVIAPGPGNTNFHRVSGAPPSMTGLVENLAKIGKAVTPEDIAYVVGFLVSDVSSKLSGQVIEVSAPLARRS